VPAKLSPPPVAADGTPTEVAESGLWVTVLGPLTVLRDGVPVKVGPAMVRNLLGLLALSAPGSVSREAIVEALWRTEPPATYANLIHVYVSRLRTQLRATSGDVATVVHSEHGHYRLDPVAAPTDLGRFSAVLAEAQRARQTGDTMTALDRYAEALAYWQGKVLTGLDPEFGQLPAAVAAHQRWVDAAIAYAELCASTGRYAAAVGSLRRVAQLVPLHEGVHARLMTALAAVGDRASALDEYAGLRRRLSEELGVDPGIEVQTVYLQVLREGDGDAGRSAGVPAEPGDGARTPDATGGKADAADGRAGAISFARAGEPSAGSVVTPRRRRVRRSMLAAALAVVLLTGTGGFVAARSGDRPIDQGVVFAPTEGRWHWNRGPSLGVTPTGEQWASAHVSGLVDGDHNAGFQLRVANDLVSDGPAGGIRVALSGTMWKVEGLDHNGADGPFRDAADGVLRVSISTTNVITMTFNGAPVMTYRIDGTFEGRGITPIVWQSDKDAVRLTDIESNALHNG
jgi:DNA-binding SARP family transcriptional activator